MSLHRACLLVGALITACLLATPAWAGQRACGASPYSYAGIQGAHRVSGVTATIGLQRAPEVSSGHVMAWVGVGGQGEGPGGTDEWLQVGISAFPGTAPAIYYEVQKPGAHARYVGVRGLLAAGARHRVGVRETRANQWRVYVDGTAASPELRLPGSHGRWFADAEAESWNGGHTACNRFDFSFGDIAVGGASPGFWSPLFTGRLLQDPGYSVQRSALDTFVASSI